MGAKGGEAERTSHLVKLSVPNFYFIVACEPLTLADGRIEYSKSRLNGLYPVETRATFSCNEGFTLWVFTSPFVRICQTSGS